MLSLQLWRKISQIIGAIVPNSYFKVISSQVIYRGLLKGFCIPLMNCYACPLAVFACPIGTMQHFAVKHRVPYYLIGWLSMVSLSVGRLACGWICPFGFMQDLMAKIKLKKFHLPSYLGYLKYVFLVLFVLIIPYFTGEHWFSKLCPWGALEASVPWGLWNPKDPNFLALTPHNKPILDLVGGMYFFKLGILAGFILLMLFTFRPFCKLMCPLGAIFSLFNRLSILRLKVDLESCLQCDRCYRLCPMDLKVYEEANALECIRCLECTKCNFVKFTTIFHEKTEVQQTATAT